MEHKVRSGTTTVSVKEHACVWIAENMNAAMNSVEGIIRSPAIRVNDDHNPMGVSFYMHLKSCNSNDCTDHVCISVVGAFGNRDTMIDIHVRLNAIFSVINAEGQEIVQNTMFDFTRHHCVNFVHKFIHQESLDERNGIVVDDKMKLRCTIYSEYGPITNFDHVPAAARSSARSQIRLREFDDFERILVDAKFTDVTIKVGDQEVKAHKNILTARSQVFQAMFENDMRENRENIVEITDIDIDVLNEVLRYMYAGKINMLENNKKDIYRAADKYQLEGLKTICEDAIISSITVNNIADIFSAVEYRSSEKIMQGALSFFSRNSREIVEKENFKAAVSSLAPWILGVINLLASQI